MGRPSNSNDLEVTWGLDFDAFLLERTKQSPNSGGVGGGTGETIGPSEEGHDGRPLGPIREGDDDLSWSSTADTNQGHGDDPPMILSGETRANRPLGTPPTAVRGRTRGLNPPPTWGPNC